MSKKNFKQPIWTAMLVVMLIVTSAVLAVECNHSPYVEQISD